MAVTLLGISSATRASTSGTGLVPPGERRATNRIATLPIAAHIDGEEATIVNLSDTGAQMVSTTRFKPNQRVRVFLPDENGLIRCHAVIAWVMFEIHNQGEARYRLGVHFTDGDTRSLQAFCRRHRLR